MNDLHLYHHGNYDDNKVTHYAKYFFKKLCDKSREIMGDKLIMELDNLVDDKESKQKQKHDKKQNKKNRKKKNKAKNKASPQQTQEAPGNHTFDLPQPL